jgi:hypothetical protein
MKTVMLRSRDVMWRSLDFSIGSRLALGSPIGSALPDGEVGGLGFYNDGLATPCSVVRIDAVELVSGTRPT